MPIPIKQEAPEVHGRLITLGRGVVFRHGTDMLWLRRNLLFLLPLLAFFIALWTIPAAWCRRGAGEWFKGDLATQQRLARTVALQIKEGPTRDTFKTGIQRFDGEWLFGTNLMAGIGFCQLVLQHPETRAEWTPQIENCIRQLLTKEVQEFDRVAWEEGPIESLDKPQGHAAFLGYFNFLLSLYRQIDPVNEFAPLNDQITATLIRRYEASPSGLIATYPNEWYPVDNAPGLASIAITGRATGRDYSAFLKKSEDSFRQYYVDAKSGLIIQAVNAKGLPSDQPRGSGSALGTFFLYHAFPDLGREIYAGIQRSLETGLFGFGAIREYPHGESGVWDIDSGPVIFGFGFSATGFTIGPARAFGDEALYARLFSSAVFAGAPSYRGGDLDFLTGGPLGNAILFAMLTTAPLL